MPSPSPVFRSHALAVCLDDETWAALERTAEARGESAADVVVYAIEQLLERAGFVPAWAQAPLDARLTEPAPPLTPSSGSRPQAR